MRTKNDRISKATDVVVTSFHVIAPKGPGSLWEALKNSKSVEKVLKEKELVSTCTTTIAQCVINLKVLFRK